MKWVAWRQHRSELTAASLLTLLVAAVLLLTGTSLHHSFTSSGASACVDSPISNRAASCDEAISGFIGGSYQSVVNFIVPWMNLLPALAGAFLGAPLLAREFEHGTWQLAWTQTITRRRWLVVKLITVLAAIVLLSVVVTVAYTWWRSPVDRIDGRFAPEAFDSEGLLPAAYATFAFSLGLTAGLLLRRVIPAMAVTLGGFLCSTCPRRSLAQASLPPSTRHRVRPDRQSERKPVRRHGQLATWSRLR